MIEDGASTVCWFVLNRALNNTSLQDEWEDYKNETGDQQVRLDAIEAILGNITVISLLPWHKIAEACAQVLKNDTVARIAAGNENFLVVTEA